MTLSNRKYYTFSDYLKETYGEKVYKITLDAGFSCPNRDGTISSGGCIFCDDSGSFSQAHSSTLDIEAQVKTGIQNLSRRFGAKKFLAYFQAYTNTYKAVKELKKIYDSAFCDERILGISIGTRPDCVEDEKLNLISTYKNPWLELGLQSANNKTLELINRGHNFQTFVDAYKRAKKRNINVCVHIILGLPHESKDDMFNTAVQLAKLGIDGIKIHVLTVMRHSPLAKIYESGELKLLDEDTYAELVCDILEILPKHTTIHRMAGSGLSTDLIAPKWVKNKFVTLNKIDKKLWERQSYQGIFN